MVGRQVVGRRVLHGGRVEGLLRIATALRQREAEALSLRLVLLGERDMDVRVVLRALVLDADEGGAVARRFQRLADDDGHRLHAEHDLVVVEPAKRGSGHGDFVVVAHVEPGDVGPVLVRDDLDDAGYRARLGVTDGGDPALGDSARDDPAVQQARDGLLGGVASRARHLDEAVDAADRVADVNRSSHVGFLRRRACRSAIGECRRPPA